MHPFAALCVAAGCVQLFELIRISDLEVHGSIYSPGVGLTTRDTWSWEREGWKEIFAIEKVLMVCHFLCLKQALQGDLRNPKLYSF